MVIIKQILNSFLFWGGWIIIPFIMEIVPALGSVFLLIRRNLRHKKKRKEMKNLFYYYHMRSCLLSSL